LLRCRKKKKRKLNISSDSLEVKRGSGPVNVSAATRPPRIFTKPIFGKSLVELFERDGRPVPLMIENSIDYLMQHATEQGLMRISGNQSDVPVIRELFDSGGGDDSDIRKYDPHTIAAVLKLFFRELPDPVIPRPYFNHLNSVLALENQDAVILSELNMLMETLPKPNRETLRLFIKLLVVIDSHSETNMMNLTNLLRVLNLTIECPAGFLNFAAGHYEELYGKDSK